MSEKLINCSSTWWPKYENSDIPEDIGQSMPTINSPKPTQQQIKSAFSVLASITRRFGDEKFRNSSDQEIIEHLKNT